jgi:hypothetical protein
MPGQTGRRSWGRIGAACLPAFLLAGCPATTDERVPVEGTITVNGQPLPAGTVVFHPDASKGNTSLREPRATIRSAKPGRYRLTTDDKPGAPPGCYKVTVFAIKPVTRENSLRPPEWLADPKYTDKQTSGLEVVVARDAPAGAYDLELKAPGGR